MQVFNPTNPLPTRPSKPPRPESIQLLAKNNQTTELVAFDNDGFTENSTASPSSLIDLTADQPSKNSESCLYPDLLADLNAQPDVAKHQSSGKNNNDSLDSLQTIFSQVALISIGEVWLLIS